MFENLCRYENDTLKVLVSTIKAEDGLLPFETGISHPLYADGDIIIVEAYNDEELARKRHYFWVALLTQKPPKTLKRVHNEFVGLFAFLGDEEYTRDDSKEWGRFGKCDDE